MLFEVTETVTEQNLHFALSVFFLPAVFTISNNFHLSDTCRPMFSYARVVSRSVKPAWLYKMWNLSWRGGKPSRRWELIVTQTTSGVPHWFTKATVNEIRGRPINRNKSRWESAYFPNALACICKPRLQHATSHPLPTGLRPTYAVSFGTCAEI